MKLKRAFSILCLLPLFIFFTGCTKNLSVINTEDTSIAEVGSVNYTNYFKALKKCIDTIDGVTGANYTMIGNEMLGHHDVLVRAIPLTVNVIQAMVKKSALERRWSDAEYKKQLALELKSFTNFYYDEETDKINLKPEGDTTRISTMAFKVTLENNTFPFRTLEVEGGFNGFFLENSKGVYGRVKSISDEFDFDYFLLDGFKSYVVHFSTIDDYGKSIFKDSEDAKQFRLVFNGIQESPIILNWNFDSEQF